MKTINLGDEWNIELKKALIKAIIDVGGEINAEEWGMAGSQEIYSHDVVISGKTIRIESETYIGLTISGDSEILDRLVKLIDSHIEK